MIAKTLKKIALGIATLLIAAAALAAHTWYAKPLSIDWLYLRHLVQQGLNNPEALTSLRALEPYGIRGHNAKLGEDTPAQDALDLAQLQVTYDALKSYDVAALKGQDKVSYEVFRYQLESDLEDHRFREQSYPVTQLFGAHSWLPQLMTDQQQVNDATDAEHYLARMQAFPKRMRQLAARVVAAEKKGTVAPRFALDKAISQIDALVAPSATSHPLVLGLREKLQKIPPEKMDATARDGLVARAAAAYASHVVPAYATLRASLDDQRARQTKNDGVWSLPDGAAFYASRIAHHTTTRMSADALHALGLSDVARIGAEMDALLIALALPGKTRAEKIKALELRPSEQYPDTDAGRAAVLTDYQTIIAQMEAGLAPQFKTLPRARIEVKRVPAYSEKASPLAYYTSPPLDGSAPGLFYANLGDIAQTSKFRIRTLAYHEGIPGHHMQLAIAQELQGLPIFRSIYGFTAYAEGWALYAERLAWEMGFQKKAEDNLGRLSDEMLRAVRLVVDTGIHAKRWTREQAISYMAVELGSDEAAAVTEIERYIVDPGQALAYKVGMLKILELREKAKIALGASFDPRAFHDVVLTNGSVPLTLLESLVADYIAVSKTGG